jgi:hypothetical protein
MLVDIELLLVALPLVAAPALVLFETVAEPLVAVCVLLLVTVTLLLVVIVTSSSLVEVQVLVEPCPVTVMVQLSASVAPENASVKSAVAEAELASLVNFILFTSFLMFFNLRVLAVKPVRLTLYIC